MRILVTRPDTSSSATVTRLMRLGHEALAVPMSAPDYLPLPARFAPPPAALVFTSAEAVRALGRAPGMVAAIAAIPAYCVGPATAEALAAIGFSRVVIGPGDGAGLAERLADDLTPVDGAIVYVAGSPRSQAFEDRMKALGFLVVVHEVYRMRPVMFAPGDLAGRVQSFRPDAVLFYSRETARLFFDMLAPSMLPETLRILCLSAAVADAVPPACPRVEIAGRPDEDALLALLSG